MERKLVLFQGSQQVELTQASPLRSVCQPVSRPVLATHDCIVSLRDLLSPRSSQALFRTCPPAALAPPPSVSGSPAPRAAGLLLGLEVFRADFHLHPFQGVGGAMPAIPGDAVQVPVVLAVAVEDSVEIGVCAAVVPVPTWHEKRTRAGEAVCPPPPPPRKWPADQTTGICELVF